MGTSGNSERGSVAWIGWLLVLAVLAWQLYLGATIQEVGVPGVFTIKFGAKQPPAARMSSTEVGIDRNGADYKDFNAGTIEACLQECTVELRCKAVSFNESSKQCWMKSAVALRTNSAGFTSAVKVGD